MEHKEVEHNKQANQENIMLNNRSTLSPTSDKEIRHAHSSSNDNGLSDE
jgi:hypothetical protein